MQRRLPTYNPARNATQRSPAQEEHMTHRITDDAIWTEVREAAAIHGWDDRAPLIAQAAARIGKRWKLDDADREAISGRAGKLWNERMTNWLGVA